MGIAKKIDWKSIFIFLFFVAFPFGQIIRLNFDFTGISIPLQPLDVIVGLAALYGVIRHFRKPKVFVNISNFLWVAAFTSITGIFIFKTKDLVYGLFYLLRLGAYLYFLVYVWRFGKARAINRKLILNCLLGVSVASALFGWIQFFMIPDLKAFFVYGWDMHLFRLVGTFLDPTFLGLIIVLGITLSAVKFLKERNRVYIVILVFLLISLAFTYSRASYLALIGSVMVICYFEKKIKYAFYLLAGLAAIIIVLPTSRNHSIEFLRAFSAIARINNYGQTLQIVRRFPVLGVGFDNLCIARNKFISIEDFSSHACSGSDSSLLFVLATTGVVGFLIFVNLVVGIGNALGNNTEAKIFTASATALLIHSLFSNSMFYPWILGWMIMLLSVSLKE